MQNLFVFEMRSGNVLLNVSLSIDEFNVALNSINQDGK